MEGQTKEDSTEFRRLLIHLSKNLKDDDVRYMKLFLGDKIGKGTLQHCVDGLDVLTLMETCDLIAGDNTEYLVEILRDIGNVELSRYVQDTYNPSPRAPGSSYIHSEPTDPFTVIRNHLKKRYRRLSKLRPFSFCGFREVDLDHMYTNLEVVRAKKHQVSTAAKMITESHSVETLGEIIWNKHDRTVSLLEGVAGVGKTTLCRQLAYQWSKQDNLICGRSFDLIFLLEARLLSGDIKQSIFNQLFPSDFSIDKDVIYKILQKHQSRCLLVIDGLDEISTNCAGMVMSLIKGAYLNGVNIILTGRPERSAEFVGYADNHLRITGFTTENAISYVRKFFHKKPHLADELVDRICDDLLEDLAENPFMTFILCVLASEDGGGLPDDDTAAFDKLIKVILQAYTQKLDLRSSADRQSFENKLFSGAGKVALFGVTNDLLQFTNEQVYSLLGEEIGNHVLQSGIINRDYSLTGIEVRDECYFAHHSIQEFLCGWQLAQLNPENLFIILGKKNKEGPSLYMREPLNYFFDIVFNDFTKAKTIKSLLLHSYIIENVYKYSLPPPSVHNPDVMDLIAAEAVRTHAVWTCVCTKIKNNDLIGIIDMVLKKTPLMPSVFIRSRNFMDGNEYNEYGYYCDVDHGDDDGFNFFNETLDRFNYDYLTEISFYTYLLKWPKHVKYLSQTRPGLTKQLHHRGFIFPWISCFKVRHSVELFHSDIKLFTLSLTIETLLTEEQFRYLRQLIKILRVTPRKVNIFVTIVRLPEDDYLWLKLLTWFKCLYNVNVHVRVMIVELSGVTKYREQEDTHIQMKSYFKLYSYKAHRFSRRVSFYTIVPYQQLYYERFCPY